MSRFHTKVHEYDITRALDAAGLPSEVEGTFVELAHGYDRPCYAYFFQVWCFDLDEPHVDAYYGVVGLGESITRGQMIDFWKVLADARVEGAQAAFDAVCLDLPY